MNRSLGEQELDLLRYLADHSPATVREVAAGYGEARGLARTTILTMMERLRKKGYLVRSPAPGGFRYSPVIEKPELLQGLVGDFVERTLGGSLSPFVAYLADSRNLTEEEIATLRRLVEDLEDREERP